MSELARSMDQEFHTRTSKWTREGYQQLDSHSSTPNKTRAAGGTGSDPDGRSTYPCDLEREVWAHIKAIDSTFKTRIHQGRDRDQIICESLQQSFEVLATNLAKKVEVDYHPELHRHLPDKVLEIAIFVGWLPPAMTPGKIVSGHREWLLKILAGTTAYFEACALGEPFGLKPPRPEYVVIAVPETNPVLQSEQALENIKELQARPAKLITRTELLTHAAYTFGVAQESITEMQLEETANVLMKKYGKIKIVVHYPDNPNGNEHLSSAAQIRSQPLAAQPKSGRGGKPARIEHNHAINAIIARFGGSWKSMLLDLCTSLDQEGIALPSSEKWRGKACVSWCDVYDVDRNGLTKALQHRITWASDHPQTNSDPTERA